MGFRSFFVVEKKHICAYSAIALEIMLLPILKVLCKLSKVIDVFTQFLIFPANGSVRIKTTKGEGKKGGF